MRIRLTSIDERGNKVTELYEYIGERDVLIVMKPGNVNVKTFYVGEME